MKWLDNKIKEFQKKEVDDFLQEAGYNHEEYIKEMKEAGFDNPHDYESNLAKQVILGALLVMGIAFILAIINILLKY